MLGPRRFDDIAKVTTDALHSLRDAEEVSELRRELESLDGRIDELLRNISRREGKPPPSSGGSGTASPAQSYDKLDVGKGRRLRLARTLRIDNLTKRLTSLTQTGAAQEDGPD